MQMPPSGSRQTAGGKRHVVLWEFWATEPSQSHTDKKLQPFGGGQRCSVGRLRCTQISMQILLSPHSGDTASSLLWSWHPHPRAPQRAFGPCLSMSLLTWDFLIWTPPGTAAIPGPQKAVIHVSTRDGRWQRPSALPVPWVVSAVDVVSNLLPCAELWPQACRIVHMS